MMIFPRLFGVRESAFRGVSAKECAQFLCHKRGYMLPPCIGMGRIGSASLAEKDATDTNVGRIAETVLIRYKMSKNAFLSADLETISHFGKKVNL